MHCITWIEKLYTYRILPPNNNFPSQQVSIFYEYKFSISTLYDIVFGRRLVDLIKIRKATFLFVKQQYFPHEFDGSYFFWATSVCCYYTSIILNILFFFLFFFFSSLKKMQTLQRTDIISVLIWKHNHKKSSQSNIKNLKYTTKCKYRLY